MSKSDLHPLEEHLLQDPDVRFGFDNYEVLRQLGDFMREMRRQSALSQTDLQDLSGIDQADISRLESGSMERGPSLLTLVRLAHAAGKRLVIGLQEPEPDESSAMQAEQRLQRADPSTTQLLSL